MAKSYSIGFESVELVDGLAPDKAVLLAHAIKCIDGGATHQPEIPDVGAHVGSARRPRQLAVRLLRRHARQFVTRLDRQWRKARRE